MPLLRFFGLNLENNFTAPESATPIVNTPPTHRPRSISLTEKITAVILLAAFVVLRIKLAYLEHSNSDEPQHLHVIWGWANGFVPYLHFFDNHTPLFHWLFAPVFRSLGERSDILYPMRQWMLPLFLISLLCIARLGALLWSPRAGLWAAVWAAFYPPIFHMMGECRTDTLWTMLWLLALTIFLGGRVTPLRWLVGGLVLGAAFATSMKTTLLLLMLLLGGLGARLLIPHAQCVPFRKIALSVLMALIGVCIIPGAFIAFFWSHGALKEMYYCVIEHNTIPGTHTPARILRHLVSYYTLWLLPMAGLLWWLKKHPSSEPARDARRITLIIAASVFFPLLHSVWVVMTSQDYVPWHPLVLVLVAPVALAAFDWLAAMTKGWLAPALLGVILVGGEVLWFSAYTFRPIGKFNSLDLELAEVLTLTKPGDLIMDCKGETIFRERAYYYVLETLTNERLALGLMKDDIAETLATKGVAVISHNEKRLTKQAEEFIEANYIKVGSLHVAGKILTPDENGDCTFTLAVGQRYAVVNEKGPISGTLDGQPLDGPLIMTAGQHTLHLSARHKHVAIEWAHAAELGFSPFHFRDTTTAISK